MQLSHLLLHQLCQCLGMDAQEVKENNWSGLSYFWVILQNDWIWFQLVTATSAVKIHQQCQLRAETSPCFTLACWLASISSFSLLSPALVFSGNANPHLIGHDMSSMEHLSPWKEDEQVNTFFSEYTECLTPSINSTQCIFLSSCTLYNTILADVPRGRGFDPLSQQAWKKDVQW